ncbi:MAG: hypothetical protein FDZ69_00265 [Deltaproteobacteria bacterium]|nr:MAG: hypothetical protein FDZ69_00265 [Deltaproteobacteria bacterium]
MPGEVVLKVKNLDFKGALNISSEMSALPASDSYVIDFSEMAWVEPFGLLFFSSQLRRFRERHRARGANFRAINYTHSRCEYASFMGLFKAFGLNYGNDPGQAKGSRQYVPITRLNAQELQSESYQALEDVRETVERHSVRLAEVLTRSDTGDLNDTISYSLRELFRNVIEHSQSDDIWYAAQCWPDKQIVQLAILDEGVGIRQSLSRNPHLSINNDLDALKLSLLPGISGVAFKGAPKRRRDAWANSGYGLFMTSQICSRGGSFAACSGSKCLVLAQGGEQTLDTEFEGTAFKLEIFTPNVEDLKKTLEQLRKSGESIAGEVGYATHLTASKSARMLTKDFNAD